MTRTDSTMPFPTTATRIQPLDPDRPASLQGFPAVTKPPAPKSRLKRLFERQFPGVVKNPPPAPASAAEKIAAAAAAAATTAVPVCPGDEIRDTAEAPPEPSSVCLGRMVQSFLEDGATDEKQQPSARCGRARCHCFNGSCDDSSDEEDWDIFVVDDIPPTPTAVSSARAVASEVLKSLVACGSSAEKDLLSETARIVERTRTKGGKEDCGAIRKMVADGLVALGYDASLCKCRWEKTPTIPAGEYEFVDVMLSSQDSNNSGGGGGGGGGGIIIPDHHRVVIDIDFRSEFQIARPNKSYRAVLQALPLVFVGRPERLQQIIALVAEEARQSLRKKGLHVPPWRRYEYLKSKWLSPYPIRATVAAAAEAEKKGTVAAGFLLPSPTPPAAVESVLVGTAKKPGELDLRLNKSGKLPAAGVAAAATEWVPPAVKPKAPQPRGAKVVTGLASIV